MRRASGLIAMLFLGIVACGCIKVKGDEVGVRVLNVYQGLEQTPKKTGTYFFIPGVYDFYVFPKTAQTIDMSQSEAFPVSPAPKKADPGSKVLDLDASVIQDETNNIESIKAVPHKASDGKQDIRLKTADGNDVWVDVTVSYQIIEDKVPVLIQKIGLMPADVERVVGLEARGTVRSALGGLATRDFSNSQLRGQKMNDAQKVLNDKFNPLGVKINSLTVDEFRFRPEYEQLLREQTLADQKKQEFEQLTQAAQKEK